MVSDIADHPPAFQGLPYTATVSEGASMGDVILVLNATDIDTDIGNVVQYVKLTGIVELHSILLLIIGKELY